MSILSNNVIRDNQNCSFNFYFQNSKIFLKPENKIEMVRAHDSYDNKSPVVRVERKNGTRVIHINCPPGRTTIRLSRQYQ